MDVNNKVEYLDVTWSQRKELRDALNKSGISYKQMVDNSFMPSDFVELAFRHCIKGYQDDDWEDKLNALSEGELIVGATEVFLRVMVKPEEEKKS